MFSRSELGTWTISELNDQLKKAQRERADLQRKTAILEEQVNGEAIEFNRRFQEREKVQLELLTDNTRLYQLFVLPKCLLIYYICNFCCFTERNNWRVNAMN
jgi:hypothetical protein